MGFGKNHFQQTPSLLHACRTDAALAEWFSVYDLPNVAFDHKQIIADALKQLRYEIKTSNIASQILPKKFVLKLPL